jgi:hypothetical protein
MAFGVVPDFGPGCLLVYGRIRRVRELLQQNIAVGIGGYDLFSSGDRAGHAASAFRKDEFCAKGEERFAPLNAHGLRHCQGKRDSSGGGHESQSNSCVAACLLDDLLGGPRSPRFSASQIMAAPMRHFTE